MFLGLLLAFGFHGAAQGAPGAAIPAPYDFSGLAWGDSIDGSTVLFNTGNVRAVSSGPPLAATFTTASTYTIVSICDYHYGSTAAPGSISLVDASGRTVGTWPASGLVNNWYWYVRPNVTIGPGTYTVVDSNPSTWSYTPGDGSPSEGMGFTRVLGTISTTLSTSTTTTAAPAGTSFADVPATHPFYAAITDLASRGVIGGYANGNFGPGDPVTRQQFAKMAVLAGGYPVSESDICYFTDVPKSDASSFYPDNYVAVAAAHQITKGSSAATFSPQNHISRYQVISMVVRMADDLHPGLLATPPAQYPGTTGWKDDPIHGANARRAEYAGLLAGISLSVLSPYGDMSRGEVAQVLHHLLEKLGSSGTTTTTQPPTTTTTQPPTTTTTVSAETLLLGDDFSTNNGNWDVGNDPSALGSSMGYQNGSYFLQIAADYWYVEWGAMRDLNLRDGRIEADVTVVQGGNSNGACGLALRCEDVDNTYYFEFSGDGMYALFKAQAGDWANLVDYTVSTAFKPSGQTNHVEITLSGSSISVSVNGTHLFTKQDGTFSSGKVGFMVDASASSATVKALFDNVKVWSK